MATDLKDSDEVSPASSQQIEAPSHAAHALVLKETQYFEVVKEGAIKVLLDYHATNAVPRWAILGDRKLLIYLNPEGDEAEDIVLLRDVEVTLTSAPQELETNLSLIRIFHAASQKKLFLLAANEAETSEWVSLILTESKKRTTLDWSQLRSVIVPTEDLRASGASTASNSPGMTRLTVPNQLHASSGSGGGSASKSLSNTRMLRLKKKEQAKKEALIKSKISGLNSIWIDASQVKLGNKIGSGSFGTVYNGLVRGSECAIKVLHNQTLDLNALGDFISEIEPFMIITELKVNNVEAFLTDKSLDISLIERLRLARDMARGIAWLHLSEPMVIHRDIKPANFLIDEHHRVVVTDFGLSDSLRPGSETLEHFFKGSAFYSAPEILRNLAFNEKSDIYSYAMVLWFVMARCPPYPEVPTRNTVQEVLEKVIWDNYRPEIPKDTPTEVAALIERCWSSDQKLRPSSLDVISELDGIINSLSIPDIGGREFWLRNFRTHRSVPKNSFFSAFEASHPQISDVAFQMAHRLFRGDVSQLVTADRLGDLLRWFGPWKSFLPNIRSILSKPWFFGELSHAEVVTTLARQPPGAYLIRLNHDRPGIFSLDYLDEYNHVIDIGITYHYNAPNAESETWFQVASKRYDSLVEVVAGELGAKEPCVQSPFKNFQLDPSQLPRFNNAFLNVAVDSALSAYKH